VTVIVFQDKQGRAWFSFDKVTIVVCLQTLEAASAWPVEAEQKAQKKLASLIPDNLFELYLLTGHFTEPAIAVR